MRGRPATRTARPLRKTRSREAREFVSRDSPLPAEPAATFREALRAAESALEAAGVEESIADARLLLAHALGASPTWVFAHEPEAMPLGAWESFRELVARRSAREPLQHILGQQEFFGLRFAVTPDVLIPRPETEILVERLLARLKDVQAPRIADVGTGSGIIAVTLATEIPSARITASDVSSAALDVAVRNARELGVEARIRFVEGSLVEPLLEHAPFDALAANLPYVTSAEWADLQPEVRDFEPRLALDGGPDGLDLVRKLVAEARAILVPGGVIALEVGHQQGDATADLLRAAGFGEVEILQDLQGIGRIVVGAA